jgi:hypothetical protein
MSQFFDTGTRPDVAAGAIAQHLRVKTTGGLVLAGASDVSIGTMELPCTAAGPCTVRLASAQGTRKMVAAGAFAIDSVLYAAADGKVDDSGTVVEGRAMEASGADGDVVEVMSLGANVLDAGTVTETGTQTLTNKTLTSPTINTATIATPTITGAVVTDATEVVAATNVIAAGETGKTFFLNHATEFVSTLPAPAAGLKFTFVVSGAPSGASYTIVTASSANIIKGQVYSSDLDAAGNADFETAGGDTITLVDSKSVAGDRVDVICDGTNWFAYCFCSVFDAITITTAS